MHTLSHLNLAGFATVAILAGFFPACELVRRCRKTEGRQ